jgi:hypothetical protein
VQSQLELQLLLLSPGAPDDFVQAQLELQLLLLAPEAPDGLVLAVDIGRCRAAGPELAPVLVPALRLRLAIGPEQAVEPVVGTVPGLAGSDGCRKILGGERRLVSPR